MASGKHNNNKSQKRSKPDPVNSFGSEDNQMMKISLTSISKLQVKTLKRKLQTELHEVRTLLKRLETRDGFGNKKVKTIPTGKKTHLDKSKVQILKNCGNLLTKLMKHKHGWIFNVPVDANGLGLHDYHTIVTKPMDLGTVKSKLSKGCYKSSPLDFAEDVRLVFGNAMLYNPKEHDVYVCAEMLLSMFEEKWVSIEKQYETLYRKQEEQNRDVGFYAKSPYVEPVPLPLRAPSPSSPPPVVVDDRGLEREESMTNVVEAEEEVVAVVPEKVEEEEVRENKILTFDEKRMLSEDLQELSFDKLEAVVQIIRKRNPELAQEDDEIELDIESLDLETLWELYRYVTENKESSSKQKEGHGLESERYAESVHDSVQEPNTLVSGHESSKVAELGHVASPVRQNVNAGGSSSSNSSSSGSGSCSSDSDSGSSGHGSGN